MGFFLPLALVAQLPTVNGSITGVSLDTDFIAEVGASDAVAVSGSASFNLNSGFFSGSERFRVGFQLLDAAGDPVELDDGAGGTTTTIYDDDVDGNADTGFPVSLGLFSPPSRSFNFAALLDPSGLLDPYASYAVRLRLYRLDDNFGFPVYRQVDMEESAAQAIFHFTGTLPFDLAVNAITTIEAATFTDRSLLQTATGIGEEEHFLVEVESAIRRFDNWTLFPTTTSVELIYDVVLYEVVADGADMPLPLVESSFSFFPAVYTNGFGTMSELFLTHELALVPDGVQLDSVNGNYYVEVSVSHVEVPASGGIRAGNTAPSTETRLLHFNGDLAFGGIDAVLSSTGPDPAAGATPSASFVTAELPSAEGYLADHPGYTFGSGPITVRLFADGSATAVSPTGDVAVTPPAMPDRAEIAGVVIERSNIRLSLSFGLLSDFEVRLPIGMGYTTDPTSQRLQPALPFPGQRLDASLEPYSDDYSYGPGGALYVMEESKPVLFECASISWNVPSGQFAVFQQADPSYVREDELQAIENSPIPDAQKVKRSNEHYYRTVARTGNHSVFFTPGTLGDARLQASLFFNPTAFITHFPYGTRIQHDFGGQMEIVDDRVDPALSVLAGVYLLEVPYGQECLDGDCGPGGGGPGSGIGVNLFGANLLFTPDGGLVGSGLIDPTNYSDIVRWGAIPEGPLAGSFAHTTTSFTEGTFAMAGHFLRGQDNTGPSDAAGAGVIHLSGFDAIDPSIEERPGTPAYREGLTDYPGINLRVGLDGAVASDSYVAGQLASFLLTGRCKYNLRAGGVTGIHEAVPGTFPADFDLYGYDFTFAQYGLAHLDSVPVESRTEGQFFLPYPTNVTQGFEELMFSCVGSLANPVRLADGGADWVLEYWLADTFVHTLHFGPTNNCDPTSATYLQAGVTAHASHVPQPLYGTLGFANDGEIITALSHPEAEVNSRLRLPNTLQLDGPGDEVYALTPVSGVYYGDYSEALAVYGNLPSLPSGEGKVNFAATMDVTFFEDLEVHVQTSASENWTANTPLFLMGGWDDPAGRTYFDTAGFDLAHVGFPTGVAPAIYRNDPNNGGDPTPYLIHARQDWLGVVTFDYLLSFNRATRSFQSYEPKENDLLVVSTSHQIEYLSAFNAEISLGVTYEGLPRINLASFVINAVDEQTGALQAITEAAQEPVVGALEDGIDEMGNLLADRMDAFYAQFFALLEGEVVDPVCADLNTLIGVPLNPTDYQNQVKAILEQRLVNASNGVRAQIRAMADPGGVVTSSGLVLDQIDDKLAYVENGIRAVIDEISLDANGEIILDPNIPGASTLEGILHLDPLGRYPIVQNLVRALLAEFAPGIQAELQALLDEPINELNAQVDELLTEVKPTIEDLKSILGELADEVHAIRDEIEGAREIVAEFEAIFANADAEVVAMTNAMRAELETFFEDELPTLPDLEEIDCEAVKIVLRQAIRDNFLGSTLVAEVQVTLKQYLFDIDAAITEGIDTAFAQVNRITRDLLADALSEVDESINGFLGDLDAVVGSGQIDGFAHIQGDALRLLRLDLYLQLKVPDDLEFHGYLQIKQLDSEGDDSCSPGTPDAPATEVTLGATDVPVSWTSDGLRMTVEGKFTFQSNPTFRLLGMGGKLELTGGTIGFEDFGITEMGAAVMFGATENYLAAELGLTFSSYEAFGGAFFGRTCTIDPLLLVDEDVAEILGEPNPTFTGIYVYGECHIPISEALLGIPASCFFRINAGVGAGAFYFTEDNTLGGKIYASISGEALCIISIKGEVTMIGLVSQGDLRFNGEGTLSGKLGACPFCIKFRESVGISYENGSWGVEL